MATVLKITNAKKEIVLDQLACNKQAQVKVSAWSKSDKTNEQPLVHFISYSLDKRIYNPNKVICILQVDVAGEDVSDKIVASLLDGIIDLYDSVTIGNETQNTDLAKGYVIHDVTPTVFNDNSTYIQVRFVAYSPDKLLSYDKTAQAFTAKRFCKEIIPEQLKGLTNSVFAADHFKPETLHNTVYGDSKTEIITPYLMQYNESFYEFMRRVAYRSGEYMFYEDEKLHVGLDVSKKPENIVYTSKSSMEHHTSTISNNISGRHYNHNNKNENFASDVSFNEEYSQEDYTALFVRDPKSPKWTKKSKNWIELATDVLSQDDLFDMVVTAASDRISGPRDEKSKIDEANEKHNKTYHFADDKGTNSERYDKNTTEAKQFTPYMVFSAKNLLLANAYREIRNGEVIVASQILRITLKLDSPTPLQLGQVITISPNASKKGDVKYVVTRVIRYEKVSSETTSEYSKQMYSADIAPLKCVINKEERIFPPEQKDIETVRHIGAQTAFVTDDKDGAGLGRVRVRFSWQKKDGDATPLIRVASQMAGNDSGMQFVPIEGEEVIVNFTNGNADLPYVSGSLFNNTTKTPSGSLTICSRHGHTMSFSDEGDNNEYTKSFFNILKPLNAVGVSGVDKDPNPNGYKDKAATGGITLADSSGIYKLDLNATKRAITINSPMGTVTVNALTGITISAPNGDVTIKGKNITLDAGNNLTVSAGGNIKKWNDCKEKFGSKAAGMSTIAGAAIGVVAPILAEDISDYLPQPPVDMKALRCVMECFARPLEGTLKLHTENNVFLEAGGEKTSTEMSNMNTVYNRRQASKQRAKMFAAGIKNINDVFTEISTIVGLLNTGIIAQTEEVDNFIQNPTPGSPRATAVAMLKAKFGDSSQKILKKIAGENLAFGGSSKTYKVKDVYDSATNGRVSYEKFKEKADGFVSIKQGDTHFNNIAEAALAKNLKHELEKAVEMLNSVSGSVSLYDLKQKLSKFNNWYLIDSGLGLSHSDYKEIADLVAKLQIGTANKIVDGSNVEVNEAYLKKKKQKYLHKIVKEMVAGQNIWSAMDNSTMAFYNANNGKVPDLTDTNWNTIVDNIQEFKQNDSAISSIINAALSAVDDKLMDNAVSGTVNGVKGLFDELASLTAEAQGDIYLTSKDGGTVKLKGTILAASQGISTKMADIKTALKS